MPSVYSGSTSRSSSLAPTESNRHTSTLVACAENSVKLVPLPSQIAPWAWGVPSLTRLGLLADNADSPGDWDHHSMGTRGGMSDSGVIQWTTKSGSVLCAGRSCRRHRVQAGPLPAIEADQEQVLDGLIIIARGLQADAGSQHPDLGVERCGLCHEIRASELIPALAQHRDQRLGALVAGDVQLIAQICLGVVARHPVQELAHLRIPVGVRVPPALRARARDDARRLFEAGRLQKRRHRQGGIRDELQRVPADLIRAPDRRAGGGAESEVHEGIGAGALERLELGIDARLAARIGRLADDHARGPLAQAIAQAV